VKSKNMPTYSGSCGIWSQADFGGGQGVVREDGDGDGEKSPVKSGRAKTSNGVEGSGPPTIEIPSVSCRLRCK
jgi:hypothetical protein